MMLTTGNAARIPLADGVVHVCTSSPPYFRQRRYNVVCDWPAVSFRPSPYLSEQWHVEPWHGELGWEPHVLDYIGHLVLVYREVYRVLRDDGQNWLNISDKRTDSREWFRVPEMLVDALAADGWRHEDTVIWYKKSAMPGSQQNRFTRDFEYIYRLNKSRDDFFDIDAVREACKWEESWSTSNSHTAVGQGGKHGATSIFNKKWQANNAGRTRRTVWTVNPEGLKLPHYAAYPRELVRVMLKASVSERGVCPICSVPWRRVVERGRNIHPGSSHNHTKDAERGNTQMHKSGVPAGTIMAQRWHGKTADVTTAWRPTCTCAGKPTRGPVQCGRCGGTGRETVRNERRTPDELLTVGHQNPYGKVPGSNTRGMPTQDWSGVETGAPCPHCTNGIIEGDVWPSDVDTWPTRAAIVLDPFVGSGTTAVVCQELRQLGTPITCVGLDLNHHYLRDLARERLGLLALEAWEQGIDGGNGHDLKELPLFQNLKATLTLETV